MTSQFFLVASLGLVAFSRVVTAQTLPTGSTFSDGIPEFTALLEWGIANPPGDTAHVSFATNQKKKHAFTFDNKWLASLGGAVDSDWEGLVYGSVTGSAADAAQRSFGQRSGYQTNAFWPTGLTGVNDFAPDNTPNNSGLYYDTIGRGEFSATSGQSTGNGVWTISFDFRSLANGYLPAGTLLSIIDTGDDANGTSSETMHFVAGLLDGAVQPWMTEIDYSLGLGYRDQPAPVWRSNNMYDVGVDTPRLATGGSEYSLMQTTVPLESLVVQLSQGPGSGAFGFGIYAPVAMPEAPFSGFLATAAGMLLCHRRRFLAPAYGTGPPAFS